MTGKLRRDMLAYSDGQKVVHWITEAMVFWTTPQGQVSVSDLRAAPPVDPGDPDPTTVGAFPGVRWLQIAYYDKVVVMGKLHAYHYVHEDSEAWIETKTLLPLAYKSGGAVYSYSFGDPPAEPLALPARLSKGVRQDATDPQPEAGAAGRDRYHAVSTMALVTVATRRADRLLPGWKPPTN